jgi:hypothetical protein
MGHNFHKKLNVNERYDKYSITAQCYFFFSRWLEARTNTKDQQEQIHFEKEKYGISPYKSAFKQNKHA